MSAVLESNAGQDAPHCGSTYYLDDQGDVAFDGPSAYADYLEDENARLLATWRAEYAGLLPYLDARSAARRDAVARRLAAILRMVARLHG